MFDRVVDERAQFINNYQKSTLRGPIMKQFSCSLVFCVLPRHTNKLPDKGFNIFDECGARGNICSFRRKSAALLPGRCGGEGAV